MDKEKLTRGEKHDVEMVANRKFESLSCRMAKNNFILNKNVIAKNHSSSNQGFKFPCLGSEFKWEN